MPAPEAGSAGLRGALLRVAFAAPFPLALLPWWSMQPGVATALDAMAPGLGVLAPFLTVFFLFALLPVLDALVGDSSLSLATPAEARALRAWHTVLVWGWAPVQFLLIAWVVMRAPTLDAAAFVALAIGVGALTGGVGITAAHELGHRREAGSRVLAWGMLGAMGYAHFILEHNQGHHARVGTPGDPASARADDTVYGFVPRSIAGQWQSACHLEGARLARLGLGRWHWRNAMWRAIGLAVLFAAGAAWLAGPAGLAMWAAQAAVGVLLLEMVNFVEHWGLARARQADGRWVGVTAAHSWNSAALLSNVLLYHLQRHSHHHINVLKRYESLEDLPAAPRLPTGYPGMVLLALVPALWRRVMGPRLDAARRQHPEALAAA